MSTRLSVIMPAHNEAPYLPATIDALVEAIARSSFDAEVVFVDDGSTDGSAEAVRAALRDRLPLTVVTQPNRGRFEARRAGLEVATGEWVLLLDARVRLLSSSLAFVERRLCEGDRVWTGHVHVVSDRNPFATFWRLLAELAWFEYFREPRTTSFGTEDFDRYPKGTTSFLAPRTVLLHSAQAFRSRYADLRQANDDTPLIRSIAAHERIHLSPEFACVYRPRTTLGSFLRHSFHRGVVFLDGHGRHESRLFPAVVSFYPISLALALGARRRTSVVCAAVIAGSVAATGLGVARHRRPFEVFSLALLAPVYALAHGLGMWKGLVMLVGGRSQSPR